MRVHMSYGQTRYIEDNPDHPLNRGLICAKGSSGILKRYTPGRLTQLMKRKPGTERSVREFAQTTPGRGLDDARGAPGPIARQRPAEVRPLHRPRSDAGAHGPVRAAVRHPELRRVRRLCSVNMAAAMLYTIGGSFWEFGGPDLERAKQFAMIGIKHPRNTQRVRDFNGGSFNTREFFHGQGATPLRTVEWFFLDATFAPPAPLLAVGSPAWLAAAFVVQFAGLLGDRRFPFAQANHPQNLRCQVIS